MVRRPYIMGVACCLVIYTDVLILIFALCGKKHGYSFSFIKGRATMLFLLRLYLLLSFSNAIGFLFAGVATIFLSFDFRKW